MIGTDGFITRFWPKYELGNAAGNAGLSQLWFEGADDCLSSVSFSVNLWDIYKMSTTVPVVESS